MGRKHLQLARAKSAGHATQIAHSLIVCGKAQNAVTMRAILISCSLLMTATSIGAQGWLLLHYLGRWPRQVVQPAWLTDAVVEKDSKSLAPVKIDAKSLQEAADIREGIQKAIDEDQFAIDSDNKHKFVVPPTSKSSNSKSTPAWPTLWQWQWPISLPSLSAQQDNWQRMLKRWQRIFRISPSTA